MSGPLFFLTATEPSGDLMGARLMIALKEATGGTARFTGVGGERMAAEGLESLFPITELAVMGVVELLPRARQLLARVRQTAEAALDLAPDAVITIDSWAFSSRVASRLHGRRQCPLIQFVAPKVWAWRPERARTLARLADHVLAQLPFEPPLFERYGVPATFVGHPIIESGADRGDGARFRTAHGIAPEAPLLCVLPGSRHSEVKRLLPVFGTTARRLAAARLGLRLVVPTVETVEEAVRQAAAAWPGGPIITRGDRDKYDAFAASNAALAASGTVAIELAIAGVPNIIGYRVNTLTALPIWLLMTVRHINLVNIIMGRTVVPEFWQFRCRPGTLAAALERLLDDPAAAADQRAASAEVARQLGLGGPPPSRRAAEVVLRVLGEAGDRPSRNSMTEG